MFDSLYDLNAIPKVNNRRLNCPLLKSILVTIVKTGKALGHVNL